MNAAVQEKISAEGTVSELRQSLEQTHTSNAALQSALYRERARNVSQEESHWANTAAFMEALQQERAKSAAQQQALEALRDEMTARQAQPSPQAQPAPTTVSLPVRSPGAVHGAPTALGVGFLNDLRAHKVVKCWRDEQCMLYPALQQHVTLFAPGAGRISGPDDQHYRHNSSSSGHSRTHGCRLLTQHSLQR